MRPTQLKPKPKDSSDTSSMAGYLAEDEVQSFAVMEEDLASIKSLV